MAIELYESIEELISKEDNPAKYCFDEAWLKAGHSGVYTRCLDEVDELQNIAIACMAIQQGCDYGTDAGPVQIDMYKRLFDIGIERDFCIEKDDAGKLRKHRDGSLWYNCNNCKYSKDRMTNFGYTLKLVNEILGAEDSDSIEDLAYYRANPSRTSFFESVYADPDKGIKDRLENAKGELRNLRHELNAFAKNSSTIGNYSCIPNELLSIGLCGVNVAKGSVGASLFVPGKSTLFYRVNDQFALFLEWLEKRAESTTEKEETEIEMCNAAMLIKCDKEDCCETGCECRNPELYHKMAAQCYKEAFLERSHKGRIEKLTEYLKNVNAAIECRSMLMVEKIKEEMQAKRTVTQ